MRRNLLGEEQSGHIKEIGFELYQSMLEEAIRRAAEDYHLWARSEQLTVQAIRSTRSWRLRERFVSAAPLRALLARRRGAS